MAIGTAEDAGRSAPATSQVGGTRTTRSHEPRRTAVVRHPSGAGQTLRTPARTDYCLWRCRTCRARSGVTRGSWAYTQYGIPRLVRPHGGPGNAQPRGSSSRCGWPTILFLTQKNRKSAREWVDTLVRTVAARRGVLRNPVLRNPGPRADFRFFLVGRTPGAAPRGNRATARPPTAAARGGRSSEQRDRGAVRGGALARGTPYGRARGRHARRRTATSHVSCCAGGRLVVRWYW